MRLLYAALFVIFGIFAAVILASENGIEKVVPGWLIGLGLVMWMILLYILAMLLFNPWWANPLGLRSPEAIRRRLEAKGLLVSEDYRAVRAFGVQDYDGEGPHYFVELDDGRVMYFVGQYLYDWEPHNDDPERPQPRQFPCTEFTVHRHKTAGCILEMECRGEPIEPEFRAPPLRYRDWVAFGSPEDGQVIADRPYDLLVELVTEATR